MIKNFRSSKAIAIILMLVITMSCFLAGCGGGKKAEGEKKEYDVPEINGLTFESELELKRATEFSVYHYNDGYSLIPYSAFPKELRAHLQAHATTGGALLVSGAYIGRDMRAEADRAFLASLLKCQYGGTNIDSLNRDTIQGLGTTFTFHRKTS